MLHFILRVNIAIITFATGVGWVYNYRVMVAGSRPEKAAEVVIERVVKTKEIPPALVHSMSFEGADKKVKFVCRDRLFSFALDQLRSEDPGFVDAHLESIGIENCTELFVIERRIDLNGDGATEIILRTVNSPKGIFYCGATGNCQTWIIAKAGRRYRILLDADSVEEVEIRKSKARFADLETRIHGGATNHTVRRYKYGRHGYKVSGCFDETIESSGKVNIEWRKLSKCGG